MSWTQNAIRFTRKAIECDECAGAERWYERKYRWILKHRPNGWSIDQACAVYACLSQNTSEEMNDRFYLQATKGEPIKHIGDCLRRVDLAISGDVEAALTYKQGRKIAAFFLNLRHPFTNTTVTIDRHMAPIVTGMTGRQAWRQIERVGGYDNAVAALRVATRKAGLEWRYHEAQARLWVHQRNCL